MKCHQRVIREQEALTPEPDEPLKREAAASFNNAFVREISHKEAATIITRYEWLKNMGQARWSVGLFFRHATTGVEYLAGAACFGDSAGTGVYASICGEEWKRNAITLCRGACVPWADRVIQMNGKVHTGAAASFLINRACRLMAEKGLHIFIAYSDEDASEVGTVYQAAGWDYVGMGGRDIVQRRKDGRIVGSKLIATKIKDRTGLPDKRRGATMADVEKWAEEARRQGYTVKGSGWYRYKVRKNENGEDITRAEAKLQLIAEHGEFERTTPKHRYIHFAGDRRTVKKLRRALKLPVLMYPKRKSVEPSAPLQLDIPRTQDRRSHATKLLNYFAANNWDEPQTILHGNVLDVLPNLPESHFAGCLSDPPYELGFMGQKWDCSGIAFNVELWSQVYRVMQPGAYILAFGAPRTYHRLTCAIEDAGFEIRDCLKWLFATGFPKSNATLKSAYEPIVLARKPIGRVLPLNIEQCRINPGEMILGSGGNFAGWRRMEGRSMVGMMRSTSNWKPHDKGRYPTNVIVDEETAASLGGKADYFYCPKASRKERDAGLEKFAKLPSDMAQNGSNREAAYHNNHPCVKPLELTKWLANLIKREGSMLVPFSGVGSEMIGGLLAGWRNVVGIELSAEYIEIAKARIAANAPKAMRESKCSSQLGPLQN